MIHQDNQFNYKIVITTLLAVIIGILIAFYYSYAQSKREISFLKQEKELLIRDITLVKADVDRLSALNELNDIEMQDSKYRVQELLDSVGKLNFSIEKLKEYRTELRSLEVRNDSLRLNNNLLKQNTMLLDNKYEETRKLIEGLRKEKSASPEKEPQPKAKNKEVGQELNEKSYLKLENPEGSGFRYRLEKHIKTNKANTVSKLRGCVTIKGDAGIQNGERVIYYQFLGPNMSVIEDNANSISVNGNVYSKRVQVVFNGKGFNVCDVITVPEGSLLEGTYTLNVFERDRLLASSEFQLK